MSLSDIYNKISAETNIRPDVIAAAYMSQWTFIKNTIELLPLADTPTEEEFTKLRVSFNIPSMGKLYTTFDKIQKAKRRFDYVKKFNSK